MKSSYFTGIDIGSSNIYIAVGRINDKSQLEIIGTSCTPSQGLKEGMVINIEDTIVSVSKAIRQAEKAADNAIKEVCVGIKGEHIESFTHQSAINISRSDKEIHQEDVTRIMDTARAVRIDAEKEIIHIIPQGYAIGSQNGVENPVGMEGAHLTVHVQMIIGLSTAINNVVKCINRSGVGCTNTVLDILAASEVVVTKEEKDLGCILMDIGGQTINIAVFYDGYLHYIKQLQIGSDMITRDIARVCRILPSEAKRLKEAFGNAEAKTVVEDQVINALGMDNISQVKVSEISLAEIIEARMKEMLGEIKDEIKQRGYDEMLSSGGILIGGGAMLSGTKTLAENLLGMPIHIGIPHNVTGVNTVMESPVYATAVGLVKYAGGDMESPAVVKKGRGIISSLKKFFDQIF